ncbi:protein-glutamate O-methyltransferase CheR [Candidatus Bathyarchaeota archaeon A05DMB-2]|jgi:chemotaxis protein methyltransferase CheR|nr:protein-glutamate O-methyltransferase CheR [Candidatus Bathyarchaeota archaeon A05DMB-2]
MTSVEVGDFLENIAFQKLKRLLHERVGLNCSCYRDDYLKRRLAVRLRATGTNTYSRYVRYLKKNAVEYNLVLNDLTINYTAFFRDRDVYLYLEKNVLPTLFKSTEVRMWSAGCATGEEPYSLAILVHKLLGEKLPTHKVTIFASDLDEDALAKAVKGEYDRKQLRDLEDPLIDKYFSNNGASYRVKDFVRHIVRFEKRDLMKPSLHKSLDLILCRNVMIFFSRESQQHIYMRFYNALREGGYLVTGKSEVLSGEPSKRFLCADVNCRVYQKPPADVNRRVLSGLGVEKADELNLNNPRWRTMDSCTILK